jgi:hypothetical protein
MQHEGKVPDIRALLFALQLPTRNRASDPGYLAHCVPRGFRETEGSEWGLHVGFARCARVMITRPVPRHAGYAA